MKKISAMKIHCNEKGSFIANENELKIHMKFDAKLFNSNNFIAVIHYIMTKKWEKI